MAADERRCMPRYNDSERPNKTTNNIKKMPCKYCNRLLPQPCLQAHQRLHETRTAHQYVSRHFLDFKELTNFFRCPKCGIYQRKPSRILVHLRFPHIFAGDGKPPVLASLAKYVKQTVKQANLSERKKRITLE